MKERLESLDILRGADMFLLLFIGPVLRALCKLNPDATSWLSHQLQHAPWDGFVLWDIIMPLFLFMSGITIPFSMAKYKAGARVDRGLYLKLLRRFFLLFLLGWIVQGNLLMWDWKMFHPLANTLQAIAVGYVVSALLFVHTDVKWQISVCFLLFAAYWTVFCLTGMNTNPQENIAMVVDKAVLGSHRDGVAWAADGSWRFMKRYQYTWVLSSLNFIVTVMMGCFAGEILRGDKHSPARKAVTLALTGAVLLAAGLLLSPVFPIVKKIWSSTMTLYSGGICFLLIAVTYYIVDVRKWGKGLSWLKIYGMNAITAYCIGEMLHYDSLAQAIGNALLLFALLLIMYKNKLFVKV
ncbi:MAG: DUF5009 domain-containing protein [Bacteroidales bacterium]|nr:DUF5009 domain-containing protein [Bacteroidales bacterium]